MLLRPALARRSLLGARNLATAVSEILRTGKIGDTVEVKGWVKALRAQKENVFADLSDGSTDIKLQVFISQKLKPEKLSAGASVIAKGAITQSPKGQLELCADRMEVCGECVVSEGYPFAPRKQYSPEYIRQHLHFRPRTNKFGAVLRVRSAAALAIHKHFTEEGFVHIHVPVLTSNDCEGAGEVFRVVPESKTVLKSMAKPGQAEAEAYFNTKAFLTVSGQLHLEAAAHGLSKVYTFGPTFRAENSKSRLHLSEFYMVEAEVAFVDRLEDIVGCVERLVRGVTRTVLDGCSEDVGRCQEEEYSLSWVDRIFPVMTYAEAVEVLNRSTASKVNPKEGLTKEHELHLVKHCDNTPVFVVNWPRAMKPFYMRELNDDSVAALDLLVPNVGELVGGSLREHDYQKLKAKIPKSGNLDWYLDLRRFGGVPTGGFGLGFERYLQFLLGIQNIKDVIPFPRWPHNCSM